MQIGNRIAPPRFLLFATVFLVVGVAAGYVVGDPRIALMVGFDVAALVFLASIYPLLDDDVATLRHTAQRNDANRVALLVVTVLISIVIMFAVGMLIASKHELQWRDLALVVATLVLAWLFANTVFALHYAHLYYQPDQVGDRGGLKIPHADAPGYWDFLYFSFTLGMTFQTSDVVITGAHFRKVVLGHTMAAFFFNIGVVAFAVNAIGNV
jgi:uncharacterized membrane protein